MCVQALEDVRSVGTKLKIITDAGYSIKEALEYLDCNKDYYDHDTLCGVTEQVRPNFSVGGFTRGS